MKIKLIALIISIFLTNKIFALEEIPNVNQLKLNFITSEELNLNINHDFYNFIREKIIKSHEDGENEILIEIFTWNIQ